MQQQWHFHFLEIVNTYNGIQPLDKIITEQNLAKLLKHIKQLEPKADGFRNFIKKDLNLAAEELLIDRAQLLTLSIPEMTVLVAGMRVLGTNYNASKYGVFTDAVGTLTNDFLVNILDFSNTWKATSEDDTLFEGSDRRTGVIKYRGTRADLIFGSNTELRAIAEVYAADDGKDKFVTDFVAAWTKVMNLDRFDVL